MARPEPLSELDYFSQVTRRHNQDERWSRRGSTLTAYRVWIWMDDRTTSKLEEDGIVYGSVLSGKAISFSDIAADLNCSWSSIQRATKWLVDVEFITRHAKHERGVYTYRVVNSTRKLKGEVRKAKRKPLSNITCKLCGKDDATCEDCLYECSHCSVGNLEGLRTALEHYVGEHGFTISSEGEMVRPDTTDIAPDEDDEVEQYEDAPITEYKDYKEPRQVGKSGMYEGIEL